MFFKYGLLWFFLLVSFIYPSDTENISEDKNITYGIETDFADQYIWRGISYNKGFLIQPSPWISYSNFTFSIWANIPAHDINSAEGNEIDFTASYLQEFEDLSFEPSFNYYTYPGQDEAPPTGEGNLKINYKIFGSEIYTNLTLDIVEYPGIFTNDFGIIHQFELSEKFNFCVDLNTGWANRKFNQTYINPESTNGSFNYSALSFSSSYYINEKMYIKPHLEYYTIIRSMLKEISGGGLFNFGFVLGLEL